MVQVQNAQNEINVMGEELGLIRIRARPPLFRLRPDAWGGTGAFARVAIPRGIQILGERAIFHLPSGARVHHIERALGGVTPQQLAGFQALTPGTGRNPTIRRRFHVNNIEMREDSEEEQGPHVRYGIFPEASRFNHRCVSMRT